MAVASIDTHTLLNAWQRRMGVSIWHFNQITGAGVNAPLSSPGQGLYVQPMREFIAEGIDNALALALPQLRFYHRPVYLSERIRLKGWSDRLNTSYFYVDAIGKRGVTTITANAAIVYSDTDADGVNDTATITTATTVTDPTEIQIFFRVADGADSLADPRWQIEPVKVSIAAGVVTVTGHRALFVNPDLWAVPYRDPNYNSSSINDGTTTDVADFITAVDVCRIYPDPTGAVTLLSRPGCCSSTPPAYTSFEGTGFVDNGVYGEIGIRAAVDVCPYDDLEYALVYYRAGYPLDTVTGLPARRLETALLRLANSMHPQELIGFDDARLNVWRRDNGLYPQGEIPPGLVDNPFGVKIGQVEAWRVIRTLIQGEGYSMS